MSETLGQDLAHPRLPSAPRLAIFAPRSISVSGFADDVVGRSVVPLPFSIEGLGLVIVLDGADVAGIQNRGSLLAVARLDPVGAAA